MATLRDMIFEVENYQYSKEAFEFKKELSEYMLLEQAYDDIIFSINNTDSIESAKLESVFIESNRSKNSADNARKAADNKKDNIFQKFWKWLKWIWSKITDFWKFITKKTVKLYDDSKKVTEQQLNNAKKALNEAKDKAGKVVHDAKKKAEKVVDDAKKKAGKVINDAKKATGKVIDETKEKVANATAKHKDGKGNAFVCSCELEKGYKIYDAFKFISDNFKGEVIHEKALGNNEIGLIAIPDLVKSIKSVTDAINSNHDALSVVERELKKLEGYNNRSKTNVKTRVDLSIFENNLTNILAQKGKLDKISEKTINGKNQKLSSVVDRYMKVVSDAFVTVNVVYANISSFAIKAASILNRMEVDLKGK